MEKIMKYFQDLGFLFIYCLTALLWTDLNRNYVFALLCTIILACGTYFLQSKWVKRIAFLIFVFMTFLSPEISLFYPILIYELLRETTWQTGVAGAAIGAYMLAEFGNYQPGLMVNYLIGCLSAIILEKKTKEYNKLDIENRKIMDNGEEKNLLLAEKNRALLEKQNSEIYAATLKERNRIAREIHDNVGHVLSRTILLTGAIKAVNQDQNLEGLLQGLDDSLNAAMDSIRSSVHDLHDEAIDLEIAMEGIIKDFNANNVEIKYDMSEIIPREIKYCFIGILKEALSNASKYSKASKIEITVREHPAMYQLCIEDNGVGCPNNGENSTGIGLKNMRERVASLNGMIQINGEKGFRIFIMIPKKNNLNIKEKEE